MSFKNWFKKTPEKTTVVVLKEGEYGLSPHTFVIWIEGKPVVEISFSFADQLKLNPTLESDKKWEADKILVPLGYHAFIHVLDKMDYKFIVWVGEVTKLPEKDWWRPKPRIEDRRKR